jgi:hypothetical protein
VSFLIVWSSRAERQRGKLVHDVRARVVAAIERLAATGHGDVKRLQGPDEFRLRGETADP